MFIATPMISTERSAVTTRSIALARD